MRLVLLGAPGSGKGTQGQRLSKVLKVPEISTGDLLRAAVAARTQLGRAAKTVMDAGQLVSDDIMLGVLRERLMQPDVRKGFILDGFPRNLPQAEALDDLLAQIGQPLDLALVINVDTDWLLQRMVGRRTCKSCGAVYNIYTAPPKMDDRCDECGGRIKQRADDNEETIGNRLRIYETQTTPVITRYRELEKLRAVQGVGSIEDVFKAVKKAVEEEQKSRKPADRSAAIRNAVARKQAGSSGAGKASKTKSASKKSTSKKKAVAKKPTVNKKSSPKKKPTSSKKVATKKAVAKKKAVKKKAVTKKKVVKKNSVSQKARLKKKLSVSKKTVKKKMASKKPVNKKKTVKKKSAAKSPKRKKTGRR